MCELIAQICVIVFSNILMYKIGYIQGEKSAYKRYLKTCNECRNKDK